MNTTCTERSRGVPCSAAKARLRRELALDTVRIHGAGAHITRALVRQAHQQLCAERTPTKDTSVQVAA